MSFPMEVDSDNGLLGKLAGGELIESDAWPELRSEILARLDTIAHNEFPIPNLPPPPPPPQLVDARPLSPIVSSPNEQSSQETNKENAPVNEAQGSQPKPSEADPAASAAATTHELEAGALPKQIADMLEDIKRKISTFPTYPPHTIQRLAELALRPRAHYKALASYLHAVDRVIQVTSGTDIYPLPPPVPDMSSMQINGEDAAAAKDPALSVSWSNPTTAAVGSDEALGGALLTPIPWLTRRNSSDGANGAAGVSTTTATATAGAHIHSESTETIEGPNGMGSIETVTVSINGVSSTGHRGVTQGELLRQEQRAGVVPVSQLSRAHEMGPENGGAGGGAGGPLPGSEDQPMEDEEEEVPHARGPDEIGVGDTGPQSATTSYFGEDGLEMQGIDLEAAVGRKHSEDVEGKDASGNAADEEGGAPKSPGAESVGSKREAEDHLDGDSAVKKVKEDTSGSDSERSRTLSVGTAEGDDKTPKTEEPQKGTDEKVVAADGDEDAKMEES